VPKYLQNGPEGEAVESADPKPNVAWLGFAAEALVKDGKPRLSDRRVFPIRSDSWRGPGEETVLAV